MRLSRALLMLLIVVLSGLIFVAVQSTSGEPKASASGGESLLDHLRPNRPRLTLEVSPGTRLHVRLMDRITDRNRAGDIFTGKVDDDVTESGYVVVPRGSRVVGRITRLGEDTKRSSATQVSLVLEQIVVGKTVVRMASRTLTLSYPAGVRSADSEGLFDQSSAFLPGQESAPDQTGSVRGQTIYEPDTRLTFVLAERLRLPVFVPSE